MHRNKQIAIILSDTLRSIGLQSLLTDYFPGRGLLFSKFRDAFLHRKRHLRLLFHRFRYPLCSTQISSSREETRPPSSSTAPKNTGRSRLRTVSRYVPPKETIIEQLQQLFTSDSSGNTTTENNKDLSSREVDVLQLIVKGITNKEIADKLNISLNTVLTHRKNITAKLGIKTVSGLTFYAIMNGIISGDDIEL